jgi:hypothetical protein
MTLQIIETSLCIITTLLAYRYKSKRVNFMGKLKQRDKKLK